MTANKDKPGAGLPPGTTRAPAPFPPGAGATQRSRPDRRRSGEDAVAPGREPQPGEPGYMAWIAELSAQPGWTLAGAFRYARWQATR